MQNIAIFASYNGSFLDTIYKAIENGQLKDIKISLIITNNQEAKVLQKASKYGIKNYVVNDKLYSNTDEKIKELLKDEECDFIVLSGYMKKISKELTSNYTIINSHPALLPKFGGKGMYGKYVHEAVINAKEKQSGATIHYVNENYDEGNIIVQNSLDILDSDTSLSLETKVKKLEQTMIVDAIKKVLNV